MPNPTIYDEGTRYERVDWRDADGYLHREDGPAIEWADGGKEWWLDGRCAPTK